MIGCCVPVAGGGAGLFGEPSQQPTWPHSRQMRRCSHLPPVARQSSQPGTASGSSRISTWSRCVQAGIGRAPMAGGTGGGGGGGGWGGGGGGGGRGAAARAAR